MKLTDEQRRVIEMLISLTQTAHHALDNSEERAGKDRTEFVLTDPWYRELSDALDALDALSDDKPGCTLGAAGKAEWALRELLLRLSRRARGLFASTLGETVQGKPMATTAEFDVAIETLRHVIECLRNTGRYTDEEGEATDFLEPLLYAHLSAPQPQAAEPLIHWRDKPQNIALLAVERGDPVDCDGTFACPICGKGEPHQHSSEEIAKFRTTQPQAAEPKGMTGGVTAHSAGAQEPVGEWVKHPHFNCPALTWKPGYVAEIGAKLYAHPQPMQQTDVARDAISLLCETVGITPNYGWVARRDALLKRIAEVERSEREGEAQHGTEKATADAEMKVAQLNALPDAARDTKDAKRYRLLRERYFTRADNPNTSAYHCVGVFTSWMPAPTIDREGLDAVLDAEIERIDRAKGE